MGLTDVEYLPARATPGLPPCLLRWTLTRWTLTLRPAPEFPATNDAVELEALMREKMARIET